MHKLATLPIEGQVIQERDVHELTIGEYEDVRVLGQFATEDQALIALGRYVIEHPDAQFLYPHITRL